MSGGSREQGTYYYLPNVPNILFFYNDTTKKQLGYSIHGTYWHNNFGTPMSHGCINMSTPESKQIFDWAEVGTSITIYGKYQAPVSEK
jgi:lipoprotein-anchoring transpeptidase ErfK/SrfK